MRCHPLAQLILRDEELAHVEESCAQALASLEILSLSHNRLASLEHFENFTNLIEVSGAPSRDAAFRSSVPFAYTCLCFHMPFANQQLNLNFNQITSLANLQVR